MSQTTGIKGHFDGTSVVLDEPASLAVGQEVRIVVDTISSANAARTSVSGFAKGMLETTFTPFVDMTATLMNCDDWDEAAALHIDPLDRIPADFVRSPGSAAGQIKMADDFADTPEEFGDYR